MNKIPVCLPGETITILKTVVLMDLSSVTDVVRKVSINLLGFLMPQQYRQFYLIIVL